MTSISLQSISKSFDNNKNFAVNDITLKILDKEFLVILGESGSGKSSLLRLIAGLEEPTLPGDILFDSKNMKEVPPRNRDVSMVFQSYALFPNMTVFDNIAFPLVASESNKLDVDTEVKRISSLLKIEDLLERKPSTLSGGEQQRVGLGRAIIKQPKVFLMDEPLSNLDAALRAELRTEIKKLHNKLQVTTVYVTHDQTEAMTMADRIAILKDGKIIQVGTPEEIYNNPAHSSTAEFIGSPPMNLIKVQADNNILTVGSQKIAFSNSASGSIVMGLRPENITVVGNNGKLSGTVSFFEYLGDSKIINLTIEDELIKIKVSDTTGISIGDKLSIDFNVEDIRLFHVNGNSMK
ncbi:MAG: ABC transporter ATP-binding protein [Thaumarchaeota archaeon]|nr:ABC transporter ATP-binding protein [Nitrososphaerota archaeon]